MKRRNMFLIIIVIILIVLLVGLTIYKYKIDKIENKNEFNETQLNDKKNITSDILDKEKYKDNIINTTSLSYDYNFEINNEIISGKIFIGVDKYIYITDEVNDKSFRISSVKMKTIYKHSNSLFLTFYLISENNKLYKAELYSNDINDIDITELNESLNIETFTNIEVPSYGIFNSSNIIALSDDGNMYDSKNGIRYEENMCLLDGIYYVYNDNTIANVFGYLLKDSNNNEFKIKYYIEFNDANRIFKDAFSIIITEDNKILYTIENTDKLNIYNKTIKTLNYKVEENNEVKINIIFEDNTTMEFEGIYTEKYGFK